MRAWRVHLAGLSGVALVLLLGMLGIQKTADGVHTEPRYTSMSAVAGELLASGRLGQTFVAEYPGLSRVEVVLATLGRDNTGPVVFHLQDAPAASRDIITLTIDAGQAADAYHAFEFSPIGDSAGRAFYFFLEAPKAEPGNAIGVWGATEDVYPDGEAVMRGVEDHGVRELQFRLGYDAPLMGKVGIFMDRLTANKPSLWGNVWLYVLLGATYVVLLYALIVQMVGTDVSEEVDEEDVTSA
jgi:hypothetical protein